MFRSQRPAPPRGNDGPERLEQVFHVAGATALNPGTYRHLRATPAFLDVLARGYTDLMYRERPTTPGGIAVAVTFVRKEASAA